MTREAAARRLGWFVVVALGTSWSFWLAVMASANGWLPFTVPLGPWGSFGPLLGAVVVARVIDGRPGLGDVVKRTVRGRVGGRWYAVALLGPLLVFAVALLADVAAGFPIPAIQRLDKAWMVPLIALLLLVLGGPLGEEVGWRSYALPLLLRVTSPIAASVMIGVVWFVWHLPLFFLPGSAQAGGSLWPFAVSVMANAFLFTWLFLHTRGSGWLAILLHTSINTGSFVMGTAMPELDQRPVFGYTVVGLMALLAIALTMPRGSVMRQAAPEDTVAA